MLTVGGLAGARRFPKKDRCCDCPSGRKSLRENRSRAFGPYPVNDRRVPHISLVFREMWDTAGLPLKLVEGYKKLIQGQLALPLMSSFRVLTQTQ